MMVGCSSNQQYPCYPLFEPIKTNQGIYWGCLAAWGDKIFSGIPGYTDVYRVRIYWIWTAWTGADQYQVIVV